ncbi:MAG TPA: ABC transporter permease [Kofleriaceae bacterium]|nr:ABC transporter permease [Kofleriaceae bacterium]
MEAAALLVSASVNAGTVLALAALGLVINERSGVVNLGAEGMMLVGALAAYATAFHTGSTALGFVAGAAAGAVLAAVFGVLVIWLTTNQYATGLALSLFGGGFAAFAGTGYTDRQLPEQVGLRLGALSDLPFVGPALFRYHPAVYGTLAVGAALAWLLARTRAGLVLRAIGESPESAHALGYPVRRIRLAAVMAGGALCGLAGAYVSLAYTRLWVEGLTAGRGWIALALTTFATWRPGRILLGAYVFGSVTMLQFHLQARGVQIDSHLLAMAPYLATILVLVLISRRPAWVRLHMPASLGKVFRPEA